MTYIDLDAMHRLIAARPTSDSKLPEVYPGIDGTVDLSGDAQQGPDPGLQQLQKGVFALNIGSLIQGVKQASQHEVTKPYPHSPWVCPARPAQ